ncbi:MAG TPA: PEP-utilizing enzyme, partial [Pyrinomonadaceae bacterium]|nr:PEP-utilizing enzyme [Pyrinomonadaceae bacterium]
YTAEMGTALWQMAQTLKELKLTRIVTDNEPAVAFQQLREVSTAQPFLDQLNDFLERHGHRCPNEGEWLHPRWSEAPEQVISVIAGYLNAGNLPKPEEVEARQSRRREEALALVERRINPFRRQIFHLVLARARHAIRLRDNSKYYYMKVSGSIRQITALLGRRWMGRGWLEKSEDIFFLTFPDVERIIQSGNPTAANLNPRTLVTERRKAFEHWFGVRAPEILDYQGRPIDSYSKEEHRPGLMIQGIAASGGQARGTARIICDPQKASRLQPGDILITRAADPGWTLLFPIAGGVVLEVGGQLSHAAIVAREYGIPAVVNVQNATCRIRDGQIISIDGLAGRVYLDSSADSDV